MLSYLNYTLTQYQDFRTLQLQYSKLKDEHTELELKHTSLEKIYNQTIQQIKQTRQALNQQRQKNRIFQEKTLKQIQFDKEKKRISELKQKRQANLNVANTVVNQIQKCKYITDSTQWRTFMTQFQQQQFADNDQLLSVLATISSKLNRKLQYLENNLSEKVQATNRRDQKRQLREQQLIANITQLQQELEKMESLKIDISNENNSLKQQIERMKYKIKLITTEKTKQLNKSIQLQADEPIQDNNFAIDFLNFEKQILKKILAKITSSFGITQLSSNLKQIFSSYEELIEVFRQKLQIQYDLEEIQYSYKRQKGGKQSSSNILLIEMRKKIQTFRNQLHKQNQLFNQHQQTLQGLLTQLHDQCAYDNKLRHYTIQLEKQARRSKSKEYLVKPQINSKLTSQNSKRTIQPNQQYRAYFQNIRHDTQQDEYVKDMVEKDRQNLQKILRQTRQKYLQGRDLSPQNS